MAVEMNLKIAAALVFLSAFAYASLLEGGIIDASTSAFMNVSYDTSAKAFIDGTPSVPDATLRVLAGSSGDLSGKNATFLYRVGSQYIPLAMGSDARYLQALSAPVANGSNWRADVPAGSFLNFLSSQAVYPARVWVAVSDDNVLSSDDLLIQVPQNSTNKNGWLPGSYGISSSYSQSTFQETVSVTSATAVTAAGASVAISFNDLASPTPRNNLLVGICTDEYGGSCQGDARVLPNSPTAVSTGVNSTTVLPQRRNIIVNGLNVQSFCIGPNLVIGSLYSNDSTPLEGDLINLTFSAANNGNSNANKSNAGAGDGFNFTLKLYDTYGGVPTLLSETTLTSLNAGSSSANSVVFNTSGKAGSHSFLASVDAEGYVPECVEGDNNQTMGLTVYAVCNVETYIDGNLSTDFPNAARPYNLTIQISRSGTPAANELIRLTEKNGLNLAMPVQAWNESGAPRGAVTYSITEFRTNSSGGAEIALVPTGDKLFQMNPTLWQYVGNYSLAADTCMGDMVPIHLGFTVGQAANATNMSVVPNEPQVKTIADQVYATYAYMKAWLQLAFP